MIFVGSVSFDTDPDPQTGGYCFSFCYPSPDLLWYIYVYATTWWSLFCQLLVENRAQVVATQQLVSEGLGAVLDKVARMQDNLQALAF